MNIGIDLDGVLTDIQEFNLRHAPPFFKRNFNRTVVNPDPYCIRDIFDCSEEEYKAYWKKHLLKYVTSEPARPDAKAFTHKLHNDGHTIYIISKRVFTCQKDFMGKFMRFLFRNWLRRNGIHHDNIVFCNNDVADSKYTACLENSIDVMIDDEPVNINAIAPIAKVICFDASYNRDCEGENIARAKNFDEVYSLIQNIADIN